MPNKQRLKKIISTTNHQPRRPFIPGYLAWDGLLVGSLILGTFLRFYRLSENLVFHGELGHNYLAIKNFVAEGSVPLIGPPTSHPWLAFGPLYYWLMAPLLFLGRFDPTTGALFMALISVVALVAMYWVGEKLFDRRVAILSTYLMAISPAWVSLARESRFYSLVALLFFLFLFFLVRALEDAKTSSGKQQKATNLFWVGMFLAVMLNFHLTPLALLPGTLILLYIHRRQLKKKALLLGGVGFIIPSLPFLLGDVQNRFSMLTKLLIWVPYRVLGFLGFYPRNNITTQIAEKNLSSLYDFFSQSFVIDAKILGFILVGGVTLFAARRTVRTLGENRKDWSWLTLTALFVIGYIGLFIHADPPAHYFVTLLPIPILFLGLLLGQLFGKRAGQVLVTLVLFLMTVTNLRFFFSEKWFFLPETQILKDGRVPYRVQLEAAKTIVATARGEQFSLSRVGPFDQFEDNYAQNYQYLLWWLGNEPVKDTKIRYTVYEDITKLPQIHKGKVYWIGNLAVLRVEKPMR